MLGEFAALRDNTQEVYTKLFSELQDAIGVIHGTGDLVELADAIACLKKCHSWLEDLAKETRREMTKMERILCLIWTKLDDDKKTENVKTNYCTAVPDVSMMARLPKKSDQPEQFAALMNDLGLPKHLWDGDDPELVRPHWPTMKIKISKCVENGTPLPAGIDPTKLFAVFAVRIYYKKS